MNLLEQRVIHKVFGTGSIINQTASCVEVSFVSNDAVKKFTYPMCFEKFLKLEDESLQNEMEEEVRLHLHHEDEKIRKENEEFELLRSQRWAIQNSSRKAVKKTGDQAAKPKKKKKLIPDFQKALKQNDVPSEVTEVHDLAGVIDEFESFYERYDEWHQETEQIHRSFLDDYPAEVIQNLSLQDYIIGKDGYGSEKSFCRRIRYDLNGLSNMGNVRFNVFEIFYDPDGNIALSKTYRKLFGDDFDAAFEAVKKEIVSLLKAAENEDYDAIESVRLNNTFKNKLITVYEPDKYIPVVTESLLNEYCRCAGVSVNPDDPMIVRNIALRNQKNSISSTAGWPNDKFMAFCDWLRRNNRIYVKDE